MKNKSQFHHIIVGFIYLFSFIILTQCIKVNKNNVNSVIEKAGKNREQLNLFIQSYCDEKQKAAEYTIIAMSDLYSNIGLGQDSLESMFKIQFQAPNSIFLGHDLERAKMFASMPLKRIEDVTYITKEYLSANLDQAWESWKKTLWSRDMTLDEFCEYILPYRLGDEQITSWRIPYQKYLATLIDSINGIQNPVDAAHLVSLYLGSCKYNSQLSIPHRTALNLLQVPFGSCRDDCDRTLYAMRSLGIPVVRDMIIASPDNGSAHQWTAVYDTDLHQFRLFDNKEYLPTRDSIHYDKRRKGKIYRQTFRINNERLELFSRAKNPPQALLNPRIKDVTSEYFGENEAVIDVNVSDDVYLGVFNKNNTYTPIDIALRNGSKEVSFHNIEPNVIFFPITYIGTKYLPCGFPFLLTKEGKVHSFKPSNVYQKVILTRKYPKWFHLENRFDSICGTHVQMGPTQNGPWYDIHIFDHPPTHSFTRLPIKTPINYRYIRLYKPTSLSRALIGEIIVSKDNLGINTFNLIPIYNENKSSNEVLRAKGNNYNRDNIVDGDLLSWCWLMPDDENMVFKIMTDEPINNIFIVPNNDDNFVLPGQDYELFYYGSNGWVSLGCKLAEDFFIEFEAPKNAVLLLKNHTKGTEEQVFIYLNGQQMFNYNLEKVKQSVFLPD